MPPARGGGDEMQLTLIQMNSAGDRDSNLARAIELIGGAVSGGSPDLVVLPEFFNTIYFAQHRDYAHIDLAEPDDGPTITAIRDAAREHGVHIVATIFEKEAAGLYYDSAFLIDPQGGIRGKYRKVHPAAVQSLEKIYFRYGSRFPVFRVGDWRVGVIVCYDTFFPESARCVAINGAELIVIPFAAPKQVLWRELMRTRAFENGCYLAPCNKVGREDGWEFGGHSMVVDPLGEVVAEAGDSGDEVITATLDRQAVVEARRRYPMFRDRRPDLYEAVGAPTEDVGSIL